MKEIIPEKALMDGFNRIVERHGNYVWAVEELEYLVFEVHKGSLHSLDEKEQKAVKHFMERLRKNYC